MHNLIIATFDSRRRLTNSGENPVDSYKQKKELSRQVFECAYSLLQKRQDKELQFLNYTWVLLTTIHF